ncbi:amidohydrolase [Flavihumibacter cheonanensis]|uniref:amidohydrolase n=1 Tax=Flavihumibacter cheonanensis TaxID=1442385 RepID=UPI001EF77029|nr:amidohydrolase [Flavihumibacter cheonanensis]MCG7753147.1 amidohydrolase [Flavihumibacter cheonanensis]
MRFLLSITALLISSQLLFSQKSAAPTLILYNGKIWTGKDAQFVDAIAITGNTITHIGSNTDIKKLAQKSTQLIDLNGQLATAGINDAHTHFLSGSMGLTGVDLYQAKTLEEALSAIEKFVKEHPNKKWITGMGWQYNLFKGGMPNREALIALDKISPDRPIVLDAYDGHSIWVNSKAMELAGISSTTQFDGFGSIIKDPEGKPTGAFTEAAGSLVEKIVPPPTTEEKLEALRIGMKYAARLGITSIQNASGSVAEFQLYETLLKQGELTLRSSTAFSAGKNTKEEDIQQFIQVKNRTKSHPLLKAVSIKFMLDGVIESHTSPMLEPYSDALPDGTHANSDFALPLEKYQQLLNRFDKEGFQVYTHAIGDRTVREALNANEKAQQKNGTKARRHRIEHIEQCNPQDVPRFAKLGVMASMQPIHADPGNIEVWAKAVGEKRIPHAFMWKSMLKNKAHLVFSSDWPACTTPDPIRGLHIAVNRQTPEGHPPGGWVPEQRITIQDALKAYTQGGAYSSFEEKIKGKLQPGYLADIIVFNQDLFSIPAMDIAKTKVVLTVFDGKLIFNEN